MKILFGQVPDEYTDMSDEYFVKTVKGVPTEFYYELEFHDELEGYGTFKITDTSGRYMPMDFDTLDELISLLQTIQRFRDDKQKFISHWGDIFNRA